MNIFKRLFGKKNDSFLKREEQNQHFTHNSEGKTLLVITVGDETTFSIDCINYYFNERKFTNVDLLFVSTPSMQKKNKIGDIKKGNPTDFVSQKWKFNTVVIDEYNDPKKDIYEKLNSFLDGKIYSNVYVNVSNGTRFTGFIVGEYFKERYKNNAFLNIICFYRREVDQETKVQIVYSNGSGIEDAKAKFTEGRSVNNYFEQFGCDVKGQGKCIKSEEDLIRLLSVISDYVAYEKSVEGVKKIMKKMEAYIKQQKDKSKVEARYSFDNGDISFIKYGPVPNCVIEPSGLNQEEKNKVANYLTKLEFKESATYEELFFACDGWFEELAYYLFKKKYNLNENQISINVKILSKRGRVCNEFDTCFINKNGELTIVECKNYSFARKFSEVFYKLDSISKKLSKSVQRIIFCRLEENYVARRENESNVEVIKGEDINKMLNEFYGDGVKLKKLSNANKM